MFQLITIKPNQFTDFKESLWSEISKVKEYVNIIDTTDLKESLNTIFNPNGTIEKLDLNTVDVLFTRDYTYQLIYSCDDESENYIASVINYKRKPIKGLSVLVKIQLIDNSGTKKLVYKEAPMNINSDVDFIIKDLFFHTGFKINSSIQEFAYDNKSVIKQIDNIEDLKILDSHEVNLFGIPFKIWYKLDSNSNSNILSYVKDIGYFLNKKISEVYITCSIYPQCKCLSLDIKIVKQFIDLITTFPDEAELKEITIAYNFANKDQRADNVFITFDDFYWKVIKEN